MQLYGKIRGEGPSPRIPMPGSYHMMKRLIMASRLLIVDFFAYTPMDELVNVYSAYLPLVALECFVS